MKRLFLVCITSVCYLAIVSSCAGRNPDPTVLPALLQSKLGFNVQGDKKPVVISFAAGWCKPCRKEIGMFNRMQEIYGESLRVKGFLVEGDGYGDIAVQSDLDGFVDRETGERTFELQADPSWEIFESLQPTLGRTLPLIVVASSTGEILTTVQRGILKSEQNDFIRKVGSILTIAPINEEDLLPTPTPSPTPIATPTPSVTPIPDEPDRPDASSAGQIYKMNDWLKLFGDEQTEVQITYESTWMKALEESGFYEEDMPFETSTAEWNEVNGDAGNVELKWEKKTDFTLCTMDVQVSLVGEYKSMTSLCEFL